MLETISNHKFIKISDRYGDFQSIKIYYILQQVDYATSCLENGASLEFLRKTLGHTELSTTQKYLHLSKTKLQEEHIRYSPLSSFSV
ncbi:hypothetical protein RI065_11690 [Mycoplasmatota bacterium zrk1]